MTNLNVKIFLSAGCRKLLKIKARKWRFCEPNAVEDGCRPYYKRIRRWLSESTEEMVKEKSQRVNEPGVVVKCLFDPITMDDIADNLPENVRTAGHITNRRFKFNHNSWDSDKRVS